MTLGQKIIDELRSRGMVGSFFDYAGYERLRLVTDLPALRGLCREYGYGAEFDSTEPRRIVEELHREEISKSQTRFGWLDRVFLIEGIVWAAGLLAMLALALLVWMFQ